MQQAQQCLIDEARRAPMDFTHDDVTATHR
jgi:hypothetical protein